MMKTIQRIRKSLTAVAVSLCLLPGVQAGGVPTVDLTAAANFLQQMLQLYKQYELLKTTYDNNVSQLNAMTGARGLGMLLHNQQYVNLLPDEFKDEYMAVLRAGYGAMTSDARAFYISQGLGAVCELQSGATAEACRNQQATVAQMQSILRRTQTRNAYVLEEVKQLMQRINTTSDLKETSELQAQISAKMTSLEMSKANLELQIQQMKMMQEAQEKQAEMQQRYNATRRLTEAEKAMLYVR